MKATIRNVLGVESASFEIAAIALIGGHNGAGKSSVLEALAAVARGNHHARGVTTKKDAGRLVRDGAPGGFAQVETESSAQRVTWPDALVQTRGEPLFLGTALGIGAVRFAQLDAAERAVELGVRLDLRPTKADLAAYAALKDSEPETIDAVWAMIEEQGWDPAWKSARAKATKLTGRWEQVASTRWGSSKAAQWRPAQLDEAGTYTADGAQAQVAAAKARLEELIASGAVEDEATARAKRTAEQLAPARAREEALRARHATIDAAIEAEREKLRKIGPLRVAVHTYPCPHCERPVELHRDEPTAPMVLRAPPPEVSRDALKKHRLEAQAIEHGIAKLERELLDVQREEQDALVAMRAAEAAAKMLAEIEDRPKVTMEQIAAARAEVATAEAVQRAVQDWKAASQIYEEWQLTQPIIEALSPEGVRASKFRDGLAALREELSDLCATAGFAPVSIEDDASITMGRRPYDLLSESERWRCDLILTLAFARRERAPFVLVDRADVLHPQARPGVFMVLARVGIPAVVCMTAKAAGATKPGEPPPLPRLQDIKHPTTGLPMGRTYWIENGRLAPVE